MESPKIIITSFGYRHGAPGVGFARDVRQELHDPLETNLRELTGLDPAVAEHVMRSRVAQQIVRELVTVALALQSQHAPYRRDTRLWVGCSGGRHRSVALAEAATEGLGQIIAAPAVAEHRDISQAVLPPREQTSP